MLGREGQIYSTSLFFHQLFSFELVKPKIFDLEQIFKVVIFNC